jgi:hypothetical protein
LAKNNDANFALLKKRAKKDGIKREKARKNREKKII